MSKEILAPMPGKIIEILVEVGDQVEAPLQRHIDRAPGLLDAVLIFDELVVGSDQPAEEDDRKKYKKYNEFWPHIRSFFVVV